MLPVLSLLWVGPHLPATPGGCPLETLGSQGHSLSWWTQPVADRSVSWAWSTVLPHATPWEEPRMGRRVAGQGGPCEVGPMGLWAHQARRHLSHRPRDTPTGKCTQGTGAPACVPAFSSSRGLGATQPCPAVCAAGICPVHHCRMAWGPWSVGAQALQWEGVGGQPGLGPLALGLLLLLRLFWVRTGTLYFF